MFQKGASRPSIGHTRSRLVHREGASGLVLRLLSRALITVEYGDDNRQCLGV
jgi:hypothetical protein